MIQAPILPYALITAANLAVLAYLIYRYSLFSAEGLALAMVALSHGHRYDRADVARDS
ncbi:MAG: hypothetical protein WDO18_20685 [Acidobacteriota bacterium]